MANPILSSLMPKSAADRQADWRTDNKPKVRIRLKRSSRMRNRLHLSFSGEIYERTRKLDTQSALHSTRRSRDIPILVKNGLLGLVVSILTLY